MRRGTVHGGAAGGEVVNGGAMLAARGRPRDWPRAYYGANYRRLARVKAAYDPGRAFPVPRRISPSG